MSSKCWSSKRTYGALTTTPGQNPVTDPTIGTDDLFDALLPPPAAPTLADERVRYADLVPRFDTMRALPVSWSSYLNYQISQCEQSYPDYPRDLRNRGAQTAYNAMADFAVLMVAHHTQTEPVRRVKRVVIPDPRSVILNLYANGATSDVLNTSYAYQYYEGMLSYLEGCADLQIPILVFPALMPDQEPDAVVNPDSIHLEMQRVAASGDRTQQWHRMQQLPYDTYWARAYELMINAVKKAIYNYSIMHWRIGQLTTYLRYDVEAMRLGLDYRRYILLCLKHNPRMYTWTCTYTKDGTDVVFNVTDNLNVLPEDAGTAVYMADAPFFVRWPGEILKALL